MTLEQAVKDRGLMQKPLRGEEVESSWRERERERERRVHCVVSDTCQSPIAYSCYGLIKNCCV